MIDIPCTPSTSLADWLTAIGTVGATIVALVLAVYGQGIKLWRYQPKLKLEANVRRPDADKVRRYRPTGGGGIAVLGDSFYFRLAVANEGRTPAFDVQVFLASVERLVGSKREKVTRFTPLNLVWSNTGELPAKDRLTRSVLLADCPPVLCDLVHVTDPDVRNLAGEDLEGVRPGDAVLVLDLQVPTSSKGHLLEPGDYIFGLTLAASNCRSIHYRLKVEFPGIWVADMDEMFDKGFRMRMTKVS
jgi:hypothetical protein